jgi:hypothetical protein
MGQAPRRIEYRPLAGLAPAATNPKTHDLAELGRSIARFGIIDPIVEDGRTGQLISGHGRTETLAAAEAAGLVPPDGVRVVSGQWRVPVVVGWSSANGDEASAALVAVNRLTEVGGWDDAELARLLSGLDLEGVGFSEVDLDALISATDLPMGLGDVTPYNPDATSDDYYTPAWVFEAMGLEFDLDPCSPPELIPWIPAKNRYTKIDDGLAQPWAGRVWLNPPYSNPTPWMELFREHGNGVALVPVTRGRWFMAAWNDESLGFASAPYNMKFTGGASGTFHTVFIAAGKSNIEAIRAFGPVRRIV